MKEWPAFDENGDLPVGIHRAALDEVIDHFSKGSYQRLIISQRLKRIFSLANQTGKVNRFIIFGSFVTSKLYPQDVDVFLLMDDTFDVREVQGEDDAVSYWQIKRNGKKRGIVEVIQYDT